MIKRLGKSETSTAKTDLANRERLVNVAKKPTPQQPSSSTPDGFDSKGTSRSLRQYAQAIGTTGKSGLPPSVQEGLSPAERAQAEKVLSGGVSETAKKDLEELLGSVAFRTQDPATQTRLVQSVLSNPSSSLQNARLIEFAATPGFRALSPEQRAQAIELFEAADYRGQGHLLDLSKRTVNGKPALLDKDADGVALVERLHSLATKPLNEQLAKNGYDREDVLRSMLQECASPGQINQDGHNTCTATTWQYMLCDQNPAEYARLMEGLLTGDGNVGMQGGETLVLEKDSLAKDSSNGRSVTERVFQSAMMEFANGDKKSYSTTDDLSRGKVFGLFEKTNGGLYADEQVRGLEALFGRDFTHKTKDLIPLLTERSPTDTYVRMDWGEDKKGGHAVVVTRVEDGRVYFRNPWGPTGDRVGTNYENPPRRLENPATREESMTVEEFKAWCNGAIV